MALLRAGLAKTQPFFSADRVKGGTEMEAAQTAARDARLKVWARLVARVPGSTSHTFIDLSHLDTNAHLINPR